MRLHRSCLCVGDEGGKEAVVSVQTATFLKLRLYWQEKSMDDRGIMHHDQAEWDGGKLSTTWLARCGSSAGQTHFGGFMLEVVKDTTCRQHRSL